MSDKVREIINYSHRKYMADHITNAETIEKTLSQAKTLDDFFGKKGIVAQLIGPTLEKMLEGELTEHLGYKKHEFEGRNSGNSRNGSYERNIKTSGGEVLLDVPRDRAGTFEPIALRRYKTASNELEDRIIGMYAHGMSTRDIQDHLKDIYGVDVSASTVSTITEKIMPLVEEWQHRPLERMYPFLFLDAIHIYLKRDGRTQNTAVYICMGISITGHKDILGHWIGNGSEGANFWLSVITDLKNRGVEDILIACVDGLTGFSDALHAVYPQVDIQRCITHQIRNSLRFVSWKDKDIFAKDLRTIYQAPNEKAGKIELGKVSEKWRKQYTIAIRSWEDNWTELSTFFQYTPEVRRIMYTTNGIESYNHSLRKHTKTKGTFPTEQSLEKVLYLAYRQAKRRWANAIPNWPLILNQLSIHFEGRIIISNI